MAYPAQAICEGGSDLGRRDTMGRANRQIIAGLIRHRKNAGMTQIALGNALGVDQSQVSKIERGERRLDLVDYLRYCRAIGLDPGELLRGVRLR